LTVYNGANDHETSDTQPQLAMQRKNSLERLHEMPRGGWNERIPG